MATLNLMKPFLSVTGKIDKNSNVITRRKVYRDPITKDVVGVGPNEYFISKKPVCPMTEKQVHYHQTMKLANKIVNEIINSKNDRYNELYLLYLEQLSSEKPIKRFINFVQSTIIKELL